MLVPIYGKISEYYNLVLTHVCSFHLQVLNVKWVFWNKNLEVFILSKLLSQKWTEVNRKP